MFTGIIEEVGVVKGLKKKALSLEVEIRCEKVLEGTELGDSIAVNGVCLTVTSLKDKAFQALVSWETLRRSNLSEIKLREYVNLERAMTLGKRFGGHMVSGHIDFMGEIEAIKKMGDSFEFVFKMDPLFLRYLREKGSIGINGISLTIASLKANHVYCAVIPESFNKTVLKYLKKGSRVNVEVDQTVKAIVDNKGLDGVRKNIITREKLIENGFI